MVKEAIRVVKNNLGGNFARVGAMPDDRLDWHLENWALSHRGGTFERGLPKKSIGFAHASQDFDQMADSKEKDSASTVDTIVEDIRKKNVAAHAALCNRYGLARVIRFPRNNEAECLVRGREYVRAGLEGKGVY